MIQTRIKVITKKWLSAQYYLFYGFIFWTVTSVFWGCANPQGITGGKKDSLPPKLVRQLPVQKAIQFKGNTIALEFDEWVLANNLNKELLITPSYKGNYTYTETKRLISLKFDKPFDENTTYTLNFRNGIKDVTEGNTSKNLSMVFSTGVTIDSLTISGNIRSLKDAQPLKNAIIALYVVGDTLRPDKNPPYYFTQSNDAGSFRLENLKKGKYKIYAYSDLNGNAIYNADKEEIGFQVQEIDLEQNIDKIFINVAMEDSKAPKILRGRASDASKSYLFEFNEGIKKVKLQSNLEMPYQISPNGKELRIYTTEKTSTDDSTLVAITAEDSTGNELKVERKILFSKNVKNKKDKKPIAIVIKNNVEGYMPDFLDVNVLFEKPVLKFDFKKIYFVKDKDTTKKISLEEKDTNWNENRTQLKISKKTPYKQEIAVLIDSATFENVEKETNNSFQQVFEVKNAAKFGTLKIDIKTAETSFIIEILNAQNQSVRTYQNKKSFVADFLPAGTYRIRAILDTDKNGKWTQGNWKENLLPEKIVFLEKQLPVRENWEVIESFSF